MKTCSTCNLPIDEEGEGIYVMNIIKKKNEIIDFTCYHIDCWQNPDKNIPVKSAPLADEKMDQCSVCRKKLKFWDSYMSEGNHFCKDCWDKKEKKLEESRQEKEKKRGEISSKRDDSLHDPQRTL
jgi:hypothetical protein